MRRPIAGLLIASAACTAATDVELVPRASTRALLAAEVPPEGIVRLRAFDAADRGFITARAPDHLVRFLEYDRSLDELALSLDARGEIVVLEPPADERVSWPLPTPDAYSELRPGDGAVVPGTERLDAWLAGIRVPRAPCPNPPIARLVSGIPILDVTDAIAVGEQIAVAIEEHAEDPARLYMVDVASAEAQLLDLDGLPRPTAKIRLFSDEDGAWAMWPERAATSSAGPSFRMVSLPDGRTHATITTDPDLGRFSIDQVLSRRVDGRRVILARGYRHVREGVLRTRFARLDEGMVWRPIFEREIPRGCDIAIQTFVFELGPDGRGRAGVELESILEFDLRDATPSLGASWFPISTRMCRNAVARLASGLEVVTHLGDDPTNVEGLSPFLAWRRPGDAWQRARADVSGRAIASFGDAFIATGLDISVVLYDYAPSRPELPPRLCGEAGTGRVQAIRLFEIAPRTYFAAGLKEPAAILSFPE